jgi:CubicO group peptidase (beta-lactamase class C family)
MFAKKLNYFLFLFLCYPAVLGADVSTAVRDAVQPFIDGEEISGAVALVARDGMIECFEAMGVSDLSTGRPMKKDDLFWIASMTKPMTGVLAMMLQEEGKLNIHDPVEKHLPEFADMWMVDEKSDDRMVLKRPARKVSLFDIMTHTAGIPNAEEPRSHTTLAELVAQISQKPIEFEPGSQWKYSTAGTNVLGRVVEVVSGERFQDFLQKRLLDPLGMYNSTFFPSRDQLERMATSYLKEGDMKHLKEVEIHMVRGDLWDTERLVQPGASLFSTADDLRRFYQMMLNKGVWNGRRLLSEASVRELTRTQTGNIKTGFTEGMSWGLKFQVVKQPQGVTAMLHPGTFGHGGAYATQSWADPVNQTIYIFMIQRRGLQPNGDGSDIRKAFQQAAFDALK